LSSPSRPPAVASSAIPDNANRLNLKRFYETSWRAHESFIFLPPARLLRLAECAHARTSSKERA